MPDRGCAARFGVVLVGCFCAVPSASLMVPVGSIVLLVVLFWWSLSLKMVLFSLLLRRMSVGFSTAGVRELGVETSLYQFLQVCGPSNIGGNCSRLIF